MSLHGTPNSVARPFLIAQKKIIDKIKSKEMLAAILADDPVHLGLQGLIILVYLILTSQSILSPFPKGSLTIFKKLNSDLAVPCTSFDPRRLPMRKHKHTPNLFPLKCHAVHRDLSPIQHDRCNTYAWKELIGFFSQYNGEKRQYWPQEFNYSPPTLLNRNVYEPLSSLQRHSEGLFHSDWCK